MYEDSWYSFVPELGHRRNASNAQAAGHRRKESLLQQPNGTTQTSGPPETLEELYEELEDANTPPQADVVRRAASYPNLSRLAIARAQDGKAPQRSGNRVWDALDVISSIPALESTAEEILLPEYDLDLQEASQREYLLYRDQLALTERHLESLIQDTDAALELLASLSNSFRAVEEQTSTFRARCEDLLSEQGRLQKLADDVGTDLHYYAYLDNVTRRLNAPGAGRLVDSEDFADVLHNLDTCIEFMSKNPTYRDAESFLARYQALLTKALHLLEVGFTGRLDKVSSEIAKQIAATQSESARHALAYGRFAEILFDSHSLLPNIRRVVRLVYDQYGGPVAGQAPEIYHSTANSLFHSYLAVRERDLRPMTQHDMEEFKTEVKSLSLETASRNFIKQCFERVYNEASLFNKIFSIDPQWHTDEKSVYAVLKSQQRSLVNPANLTTLATNLLAVLQAGELKSVCTVVGWLLHEYLLLDYDEDESPFVRLCRELSARLLTEHLWPYTDAAFEAELTKAISKTPIIPDTLKIGPVVGGVSSSNAYPPVKKALELLAMFDGCMPKERSQKNSQVVFKIIRETIQVLQRAEARIKASKTSTDPDLFMVKNLLILKNELVSLEIGDIRSQAESMQHFSQIWEALSPGNLVGFLGNIIGGSLWSLGGGATATPPPVTAKTLTVEDMSEQLDQLLRQSIGAFTQRWASVLNDATGGSGSGSGKNVVKIERQLEEMLNTAFSNQPEVVGKLREAISLSAQAQRDAASEKKGARRY